MFFFSEGLSACVSESLGCVSWTLTRKRKIIELCNFKGYRNIQDLGSWLGDYRILCIYA